MGRGRSEFVDSARRIYRTRFDETLEVAVRYPLPYSNTFHMMGRQREEGRKHLGRVIILPKDPRCRSRRTTTTTTITDHSPFSADHQNILDIDSSRVSSWRFATICMGAGLPPQSRQERRQVTDIQQTNQVTLNQLSTSFRMRITALSIGCRSTLGSKFNHNKFTGFELSPNARC